MQREEEAEEKEIRAGGSREASRERRLTLRALLIKITRVREVILRLSCVVTQRKRVSLRKLRATDVGETCEFRVPALPAYIRATSGKLGRLFARRRGKALSEQKRRGRTQRKVQRVEPQPEKQEAR